MKSLFCLVIVNLFGIGLVHATGDTLYPEVGKRCPEFLLKNVTYYNKKEVTLADFKGKWLVLDFWNKYCSSCIASFPKVNAMQKEFGDNVQFMLVGIQDAEGKIRPMYEHLKEKLNLRLACAFDSTLSDHWGIITTPHILVIDDKGIVQARTFKVDSADIQKFLKGEHPVLSVVPFAAERKGVGVANIGEQRIPFNNRKPYMVEGNGSNTDSDFLFRSVLTKWNQAYQSTDNPMLVDIRSVDPSYPKGMFQAIGASLEQLYLDAYFGRCFWLIEDTTFYGKYSKKINLQVADSSLFQFKPNGENVFCYSLILPPERGTRENLQKAMQRDLETYFGFDVSIETQKIPSWRLIATEGAIAKLSTKGSPQSIEEIIPRVSLKFSNVPMRSLVRYLTQFSQDVIIDDTGITQNIDITTDCTDFNNMKAFLPKYGLKLISSEKEMKVIVIRDAKK